MSAEPERVGNYLVFPAFAKGGMATVHLARVAGSAGFRRIVVVKRILPGLASEPEIAARFLQEARLSSRVRSPHVVPTVDVVEDGESLLLAMDLVEGVTFGRLLSLAKTEGRMPAAVAVAIVRDLLRGLHSAHEATSEDGTPLEIVHRDITPSNVMVGADGQARVLDFGIAKTLGQSALTATGEIRGTLGYVAPEQLRGQKGITRAADLYSVGVILWEALTGQKLRAAPDVSSILRDVESGNTPPPSSLDSDLPAALDTVVLHALAVLPSDRPKSAEAMRTALERALAPASQEEVRRYLDDVAADEVELLRERVRACELYAEGKPKPTTASPKAPDSNRDRARTVGRYVLYDAIASGGMATVHVGRLEGSTGFARTVAIKRLHPHLASDRRFTSMLLDEARTLVRVRHPNVVSVLDVVEDGGELLLVMDYVQGETVSSLLDADPPRSGRLPPRIACAILAQALHGLHAAHESRDERGQELGIVHRDFSPHNLMVGFDGVARVLDFGIAKAAGRIQETRDGELKGKVTYMPPELLTGGGIDRRADVWGAALVLSEMLTGERLFEADSPGATMNRILAGKITPPSEHVPNLPSWIDGIVKRGLERDPAKRFATALQMALAIEENHDLASPHELGEWTRANMTERSRKLAARIGAIESGNASPPNDSLAPKPNPSVTPPIAMMMTPATVKRPGFSRMNIVLIAIAATSVAGLVSSRLFSHTAPPDDVVREQSTTTTAPTVTPPPTQPTASPSTPVAAAPSAIATGEALTTSAPPSVTRDAGRVVRPASKSANLPVPPPTTASATAPGASASAKRPPPIAVHTCDPPYTIDANGFRVPKPDCI
jgi:serine/threonine-protein kinase